MGDDYTAVEASTGGQVQHGDNIYERGDKAAAEAEEQAKMQAHRQERLNELLGAFREQLFPYRDQIQPMFAETDMKMDGHCDYDTFSGLLTNIGVQVDEEDMQLLMESFFDPDFEDQTRPMSIAVLDEALFG